MGYDELAWGVDKGSVTSDGMEKDDVNGLRFSICVPVGARGKRCSVK